ncbi:PspC domain-containing protein [Arthrobacter sp. 1P04PC]|uniref:PspC domain-containing protein n=1 Tax=unclassified Arthrobacter TaxID=235627 RepID=UPI00399F974E
MNTHPDPDEVPAAGSQPDGRPATDPADSTADASASSPSAPSPSGPSQASSAEPDGAPRYAPPSYTPPPYTPPPGGTPPYTPPPGPPYAGERRPAGSQQNFFDWIRSHGIHRGRERWVAGVASGIAQRLGVDPLIVRGILIVLTVFAGVGVLLYGLAWALLPEPDGRIHVQEAAAGRWSTGMTGALITTLIGFPSLGNGVWGWDRYGFGAVVWTVFWVGGAIYAFYYFSQRGRTRRPADSHGVGFPQQGPAATGPAATGPGSSGTAPYGTGTPAGFPSDGTLPVGTYPAASYPTTTYPTGPDYTAAPAAPAPGRSADPSAYAPVPAPKVRATGPGAPAVAVTTGLALLAGGGLKALDAVHAINLGPAGNAVVWAVGAAVLGLGILVCGLRGRGAGILSFFAVVALVTGAVYGLIPNADRARFQNVDWAPTTIGQAADGFDITGGSGTVDLTRLDLNAPLSSDVVVPLDATASNITVLIPRNVPVQIRADLTMGNLNDSNGNHGGMTSQQSDYNTDVAGSRLVIKVSGTLSNITVKEGN